MAANFECALACGWGMGNNYEIGTNWHSGALPGTGLTRVALPSAPTSPATTGFGLQYENDGMTGGMATALLHVIEKQTAVQLRSGGLSLLFRPKTNPSGGSGEPFPIFAADSGGLGGFTVAWGTDKKLWITDQINATQYGVGSHSMDAGSPDWYFLRSWWDDSQRDVWCEIWKYNSNAWDFIETVYGHLATMLVTTRIRMFQTYGNVAGGYYVTNLYVNSGWKGPKLPNFEYLDVSTVKTGHTSWVRGDTGLNDDTTEVSYVGNPSDADYAKISVLDPAATTSQYYQHAGFTTGQNILAVGTNVRYYGTNTANQISRTRIISGATSTYGQRSLPANDVWFHTPLFTSKDPAAGGGLTDTLVNTTFGYGHAISGANGAERRAGHQGVYLIYGPDESIITIPRKPQVIGGS